LVPAKIPWQCPNRSANTIAILRHLFNYTQYISRICWSTIILVESELLHCFQSLSISMIPSLQISLREAVRKISKTGGQGYLSCKCKGGCKTSKCKSNIFLGSVGPRSYCGIGIITLFPTESSFNFRFLVLISFSACICCPDRARFRACWIGNWWRWICYLHRYIWGRYRFQYSLCRGISVYIIFNYHWNRPQ
jgi:hypothetical protein